MGGEDLGIHSTSVGTDGGEFESRCCGATRVRKEETSKKRLANFPERRVAQLSNQAFWQDGRQWPRRLTAALSSTSKALKTGFLAGGGLIE